MHSLYTFVLCLVFGVCARGALSKAVKALRVKELDARVKGKLLVATIMNVLLYGSETWLIRAEDKLCL